MKLPCKGSKRLTLAVFLVLRAAMVGSFAVGLLFFMTIPSLTPLNSGATNVLICLIGGALFSGVFGMVSGKVLNATSLV